MHKRTKYSYDFIKTDINDYGICKFAFDSSSGLEHSILHAPIKPGLYFSLYHMPVGTVWDVDFQIDNSPITFSFCVQGKSLTTYKKEGKRAGETIYTKPGKSLMANLSHTEGGFQIDNTLPYRSIGIAIDHNLLYSYIAPFLKTIPDGLTKLMTKGACGATCLPMNSKMKKTIFEIASSNISSPWGQMFLESKILELLAYQIEAFTDSGRQERQNSLSDEDMEMIYGARDILLGNIREYPGIIRDNHFCVRKKRTNENRAKSDSRRGKKCFRNFCPCGIFQCKSFHCCL